jgi:hypothetical protein
MFCLLQKGSLSLFINPSWAHKNYESKEDVNMNNRKLSKPISLFLSFLLTMIEYYLSLISQLTPEGQVSNCDIVGQNATQFSWIQVRIQWHDFTLNSFPMSTVSSDPAVPWCWWLLALRSWIFHCPRRNGSRRDTRRYPPFHMLNRAVARKLLKLWTSTTAEMLTFLKTA